MLKPDRFSCSQKIRLKRDPPVHLDILKRDMTLYSSPIMLIVRKNSSLKRIITDYRLLNIRWQRVNFAFPLIRDALQFWEDPHVNAY